MAKLNVENRLYIAFGVSSLGSWLTFLAIALILNDRYGSDHVAYAFLIQSLPSVLLSPLVPRLIPQKFRTRTYLANTLFLAINVLVVAFFQSKLNIYIYMVVGSIVGAFQKPLMDSLIPEWVEKERLSHVLTRVGSINSIMLMFAPALGGWISQTLSYKALMIMDAASFFAAFLLILPQVKLPNLDFVPNSIELSARLFLLHEQRMNPRLRSALFMWYAFILIGGLFNGIEFYLFKEAQLSPQQTGILLGTWGAGSLLAFLSIAHLQKVLPIFYVILYSCGFTAFVYLKNFEVFLGAFLIGGLSASVLAGLIRSKIQSSIEDEGTLSVWSIVNSRLALLNVICYGGSGWLIANSTLGVIQMIALACVAVLIAFGVSGSRRLSI